MWQLVKAESEYNRNVLLTLFFFLSLVYMSSAYVESRHLKFNFSIVIFFAAGLMYILFSHRFLEKRIRMFRMLPVASRSAAFARLCVQGLYYLGALLIFVAVYLSVSPVVPVDLGVWRMLFLSAVVIITNALYAISVDLFSDKSGFARTVAIIALWLMLFTLIILYEESTNVWRMSRTIYFSPAGIIALHLIGIGLSILSIAIFKGRRTYIS
jgi:hypothetical protein